MCLCVLKGEPKAEKMSSHSACDPALLEAGMHIYNVCMYDSFHTHTLV